MKKPNVNEFSKLKAPIFEPSIWFKIFPSPLTVTIPQKFMVQCCKELVNLCPDEPPLGEELYAFAYEKYTGRDIFDFPFLKAIIFSTIFASLIAFIAILICTK